jgi:putative ABC transport system permease protein
MPERNLKIRLAWLQLKWDKLRLAAAVSGIVFAVTLMLMQMGFRDALFVAAIQFHQRLQADLVIMSSQYEFMATTRNFSENYLYRLLSVDGVQDVAPVYMGVVKWRNPVNLREMPIFVIGMDPSAAYIDLPGVQTNLSLLKMPDVVLFDVGSKPDFGPVPKMVRENQHVTTEVSGRRVDVQGLFFLGLSYGADGNLFTSDLNFLRLMPYRHQGLIDLGLIRLKPGADAARVMADIQSKLSPDLKVMDRGQYTRYERDYWDKRTPVGFIFNLGALVGFIVGAVIVYQILYTDVTDHLGEYATLKAMGYSDRQLYVVVMQEALILSIMGFVPGWLIATGMAILTRKLTMLPSYMTWERATTVLVLTIGMCVGSAAIAMRKLRSADPADIF